MESGWPTGLGTCSGSILVDGFFEVSVLPRSEAKTNPLSLRLDVGEAVGAPNFRGVPAHAAARAARALGTCGLLERIARIGPGSCFCPLDSCQEPPEWPTGPRKSYWK